MKGRWRDKFLSFFPQIKEIERRKMGERCQFSGLSPHQLRYFISPSVLSGDYSRRKRGGNVWNEKGAKVSSFYLLLFDFFPPFLQEGKRLDEMILKIHKFKYRKAKSSQRLVRQHWIKMLNFDLLKMFIEIEHSQKNCFVIKCVLHWYETIIYKGRRQKKVNNQGNL